MKYLAAALLLLWAAVAVLYAPPIAPLAALLTVLYQRPAPAPAPAVIDLDDAELLTHLLLNWEVRHAA